MTGILLLLLIFYVSLQPEKEEEAPNYSSVGTIGRGGSSGGGMPGMPDMMTEMALRLKERRAKAEGLTSVCTLHIACFSVSQSYVCHILYT